MATGVTPRSLPPSPPPLHADAPPGLEAARGRLDDREVLVLSFPCEPSSSLEPLSAAERAVVEALLTGASNADIARLRGRSVQTVAKQVASALHKLGVRSRGELAAAMAGAPSKR